MDEIRPGPSWSRETYKQMPTLPNVALQYALTLVAVNSGLWLQTYIPSFILTPAYLQFFSCWNAIGDNQTSNPHTAPTASRPLAHTKPFDGSMTTAASRQGIGGLTST